MSKGTILRFVYCLSTIPINFIANILLSFNIFQLKENLEKCTQLVDTKCCEIPDSFTPYLIAAEDHRSLFHFGIDHIGIIRAIIKRFFRSEIQGASTIEQQFVRVVTGDFSFSLPRKIKEQLLAICLAKKRSKNDIAKAYLAIAYYGHNCEGVEGLYNIVGGDLLLASENQIILVVARLKYPKPSTDIEKWERRISHRVSYIRSRHQQYS